MYKKIAISLVVLILMGLNFVVLAERLKSPPPAGQKENSQVKKNKPSRVGEEIVYDVKLGMLSLGQAKFKNAAMTSLNRKKVSLVIFETRLVRFTDREEIYSDPDTFLPLRVERDISMWPKKESIVEEYDQGSFTLAITKVSGNKKESREVIKKQSPISNAILLPYSLRDVPDLRIGWSLPVVLPTQEFEIRLVSREEVTVPAGKFDAYRFESTPDKFEIWISADKRRIPLKIKGLNKLGYTLVMKTYVFEDK